MAFRTALWWLLAFGPAAAAETGSLRGTVRVETSGETLPYASVRVDSLNTGTVADRTGYFLLQLPEGEHRVTFSYVGYEDLTESVKIKGGRRPKSGQSCIPL